MRQESFSFPVRGVEREQKNTTLDGIIRGVESKEGERSDFHDVSLENANYHTLLGKYRDDDSGKHILGTKSVVLNMDGTLKELLQKAEQERGHDIRNKYDFSNEVLSIYQSDFLESKFGSKKTNRLLDDEDYLGVFWSNTSEIHHRDMMMEFYHGLANAIGRAEKGDGIGVNIFEAVEDIKDRKITQSGVQGMGKAAQIILGNSQGYQLSSVEVPPEKMYREGVDETFKKKNGIKLNTIQVSSAITKDQEGFQNPAMYDNRDTIMTKNQRRENLQNFLNRIKGMTINTQAVETGKEYLEQNEPFYVTSWDVHRQSSRAVGSSETKKLHILYDPNLP